MPMILVQSGNYKIPCTIEQSMYIPEQVCTSSPPRNFPSTTKVNKYF